MINYNLFKGEKWRNSIDLADFIKSNLTRYNGDESFLKPTTERTKAIWNKLLKLIEIDQKKGIYDLDVETPSSIISHKAGYIDKKNEIIVGLQTDEPLKRAIKPNGGIRFAQKASESYGYKIPDHIVEIFEKYRKTHNQGVFDAYDDEIRLLRSKHIIAGLPDSYGRGRIIGDYRRVALYGVDFLIEERQKFLKENPALTSVENVEESIRIREEVTDQIKALEQLKEMAKMYGYDISKPAKDSKEAVQWLYFAYLGAIKEQDGAAMSLGRVDAFLDIYFEHDLKKGIYKEEQIQEIVDDFIIKLRIARHLRHPEYNALFAGDPTWITMVLGGVDISGEHMVTKTAYRILHTLTNMGPWSEPNLTVLWSDQLPESWKKYCAKQSILSSSIQYENDDLMKPFYGDDYGIACCVSGMTIGKDMQFFGARANLAKALLLAINGGKDEPVYIKTTFSDDEARSDGMEAEKKLNKETAFDCDKEYCKVIQEKGGDIIIPNLEELQKNEYLDFDSVWRQYMQVLDWIAERYARAMNIIHYMHDKYHYETLEMALHDEKVRRFMAYGFAGLSIVADSLSAIKYAKVKPVLNYDGVAEDYIIKGDYPKFGNDDDRVDNIAVKVVENFIKMLRKYKTYRNSIPTLSILTITSNVVYGKATGSTPDGRESGTPFAPGANPMHKRDSHGAISSLNSVSKISYDDAQDGISNTFSIIPASLGKNLEEQKNNLVNILDGYFVGKGGHHLNVNVLNRETLIDAQKHPEKYPQLTIRVSGYAVWFNNLSKEQQDEVIARTFHDRF